MCLPGRKLKREVRFHGAFCLCNLCDVIVGERERKLGDEKQGGKVIEGAT